MRKALLTNALASALIAAGVAALMAWQDAPTWAWLGIGCFVYLHEVKVPAREIGRRWGR